MTYLSGGAVLGLVVSGTAGKTDFPSFSQTEQGSLAVAEHQTPLVCTPEAMEDPTVFISCGGFIE